MKIGIVISQTPTYSETFFNSKIRGLKENGLEVILFTQRNKSSFKLCKVVTAPKVYRNPVKTFFSLVRVVIILCPHIRKVVKFLKLEHASGRSFPRSVKNLFANSHLLSAKKLDWIHFGFATMAINSENVAKAIGAKMAVSLRGFDMAIYPLKHLGCYNLLWQRVDKLHTISNDLLNIARRLGLPQEIRVVKITPAIDIAHFVNTPKRQTLNKGKIKLLTVARLHWKKGLMDTLESLKLLKDNRMDFTYTIVGQGEEYEPLAFAVHQLGLSEEVVFEGKKTSSEIAELMKENDIYLQYSISEGFCNAVLEAQAMGMLCIVSDAEGLPENVLHNKTGWVIPKQQPKELAKTILRVIGLPQEEQNRIRRQAEERVIKNFNLSKQNRKFVEFYKS